MRESSVNFTTHFDERITLDHAHQHRGLRTWSTPERILSMRDISVVFEYLNQDVGSDGVLSYLHPPTNTWIGSIHGKFPPPGKNPRSTVPFIVSYAFDCGDFPTAFDSLEAAHFALLAAWLDCKARKQRASLRDIGRLISTDLVRGALSRKTV
jgi:hypothetical protein